MACFRRRQQAVPAALSSQGNCRRVESVKIGDKLPIEIVAMVKSARFAFKYCIRKPLAEAEVTVMPEKSESTRSRPIRRG
jgi:hypothetical protein